MDASICIGYPVLHLGFELPGLLGVRSICLVFSVGVLGFQESVWFFKVWVSDVGALSGTKKNLFALSLTFDFEEPAWFGKLGVPLVGFQVCGFLS